METWLNVAEKPSVARELTRVLSVGNRVTNSRSPAQYNPNMEFDFSLDSGQTVKMIVTSVTGHVMEEDFDEATSKNWKIPMLELFDRPTRKSVRPQNLPLQANLEALARRSQRLVCWLDCDREGENISFEVIQLCRGGNNQIGVRRAKFSSLTDRDLRHAINNLVAPNELLSSAVDARSEIDLRIGAAFTRFQTLTLRRHFAGMPKLISYGACQFPTLGFIIDRYWAREAFQQELFWKIVVTHGNSLFLWRRGVLFDRVAVIAFYAKCLQPPIAATIIKVDKKQIRKLRPAPLSTVEMQKLASRHLRLAPERCMTIAEGLYQEGYLSYPRTETDCFHGTDEEILECVRYQVGHPQWGAYAAMMSSPGSAKYVRPRDGGHDDKAHPPIHPTKALPVGFSDIDKLNLYSLVARHFLAVCSGDAVAFETVVVAEIGIEKFKCRGQCIQDLNWLEVFTYEKWLDKAVPIYNEGQVFQPDKIVMEEGKTTPPTLLGEVDLITLMDKNGIGTDATIASHIKTILDREYAVVANGIFTPTKLGLALTQAYEAIDLFPLLQPNLRAGMEHDMVLISRGEKTKQEVVRHACDQYKQIFAHLLGQETAVVGKVREWFAPLGSVGMRDVGIVGQCGVCRTPMILREGGEEHRSRIAWCDACRASHPLPWNGTVLPIPHVCPLCHFGVVQITNTETNRSYHVCMFCFSSPPGGIESLGTSSEMRCFQCTAECALASGESAVLRKCPHCHVGDVVLKRRKPPASGMYLACKAERCPYRVMLPQSWQANVGASDNDRCGRCHGAKVMLVYNGPVPVGLDPTESLCFWCCRELVPWMVFEAPPQMAANNHPHRPHQAVGGPPPQQPPDGANSMSCYKCGQQGHMSRNCPAAGVARGSQGGRRSRGEGSQPRGRGGPRTRTNSHGGRGGGGHQQEHQQHHQQQGGGGGGGGTPCGCGVPSARRLCGKEGQNKGRWFWCCPKGVGDPGKCNFFAWE